MPTRTPACLLMVACAVLAAGPAFAVTPSCGCGTAPPANPGQSTTRSIIAADYPGIREGSYELNVPDDYLSTVPMPLWISLHGWLGTGSSHRQDSRLVKTADLYGFIPAFPDGLAYPEASNGWAFPGCSASPPAGGVDAGGRRAVCTTGDTYYCDQSTCPSSHCEAPVETTGECVCIPSGGDNCNWCGCVDDPSFLRAVAADITKLLCVDLDRIYLSGMSAGGMMTSWMQGETPELFAAFAPVSGTDPRDFYNVPGASRDAGVIWVHGENDSTVPHDGIPASDGYFYEATDAAATRVAASFGCDIAMTNWPVPASVQPPGSASLDCFERANCPEAFFGSGNRQVIECLWGGGHTWPRSNGGQESAAWGNRLMLEFFLAHERDALEPQCAATSCSAPTQLITLVGAALSTDGARLPIFTALDPNANGQVSGYQLYRSSDPTLAPASWPIVLLDTPDQDLWTADRQLIDATGDDPAPGVVFYYDAAAYNGVCPAEGPR